MSLISAELDLKETTLDYSEKLLSLGQGAPLPKTNFFPIHKFFEGFVDSKPKDISVTYGKDSYSYEILNIWSNNIAYDLLEKGVKPGNRVAILIEPSAAMVAATLGILKCGAAYVPLDITQPAARIASLVSNASVAAIFTHEKLKDQFAGLNLPIYTSDYFPQKNFDFDSHHGFSLPNVSPEDIAYLIYTSGSTGEPKGVLIGHHELTNSTLARHLIYPGKPTFLMVSPLFCDSSAAGLWGTLSTGGQLIVASYEESRDPEALLHLIKDHKVTKILCIPSLYGMLLDIIEKTSSASSLSLDTVIVAGEPLHQSLLNRHFSLLGNTVEVVNEYGPTEATIWATYRRFASPEPVSIGGPTPGTSLYVLDDSLQLSPLGEIGELFIGGHQVAKGYFGRSEASHKVFIPDPFSQEVSARMYKTGDLVRWNIDGALEFIGRKDHQVKIRGYRIELSAIETVLCSFPEIREATVLANKELTGLIAFTTLSTECSQEILRQKLALELPSYMIPSKIFILDKLPLMSSGKVDREALSNFENSPPPPSFVSEKDIELSHEPNKEVSEQIISAWSELLNLSSVPKDVNFFDLGGHSLMVFKLQEALERHTGIRPPVVALFRHTTVSAQAKFIEHELNSRTNSLSTEIAA
jgi:amino acid adenylation domain-containing protein